MLGMHLSLEGRLEIPTRRYDELTVKESSILERSVPKEYLDAFLKKITADYLLGYFGGSHTIVKQEKTEAVTQEVLTSEFGMDIDECNRLLMEWTRICRGLCSN